VGVGKHKKRQIGVPIRNIFALLVFEFGYYELASHINQRCIAR